MVIIRPIHSNILRRQMLVEKRRARTAFGRECVELNTTRLAILNHLSLIMMITITHTPPRPPANPSHWLDPSRILLEGVATMAGCCPTFGRRRPLPKMAHSLMMCMSANSYLDCIHRIPIIFRIHLVNRTPIPTRITPHPNRLVYTQGRRERPRKKRCKLPIPSLRSRFLVRHRLLHLVAARLLVSTIVSL